MYIGKKIRMFRERLGFSQQQLGHMVHVSENTIGHYETGRRNPSIQLLKEIANMLKVDLNDFFEEEKKSLLQLPMNYVSFIKWLEKMQYRHDFGWFTSERFEYEIKSDRYFVELKRKYLIWLKDGFYLVPLKSEWVDSEMNDDVIDVENVRKVIKSDIADIEKETRRKFLITYDEKLFAEQVYTSKYDFQPLGVDGWENYDDVQWASVTNNNILAYIHKKKACFVYKNKGIMKLPIYDGMWEFFKEEGLDPYLAVHEEEEVSLDEDKFEIIEKRELNEIKLFMIEEEYFIKRLFEVLKKKIDNTEDRLDLPFEQIEEKIDELEQMESINEKDYDKIANLLRYRIWSLDNLKRINTATNLEKESIFDDEWVEEEEVKTMVVRQKQEEKEKSRKASPKDYRILIADNGVFGRTIIRSILERNYNCYVDEAKNGEEAIQLYQSQLETGKAYDLAILEVIMYEKSGIDALEEIVKLDREAKVIMCSSFCGEKTVIESIQKGAKHFIKKPFQEESTLRVIGGFLPELKTKK